MEIAAPEEAGNSRERRWKRGGCASYEGSEGTSHAGSARHVTEQQRKATHVEAHSDHQTSPSPSSSHPIGPWHHVWRDDPTPIWRINPLDLCARAKPKANRPPGVGANHSSSPVGLSGTRVSAARCVIEPPAGQDGQTRESDRCTGKEGGGGSSGAKKRAKRDQSSPLLSCAALALP